MNMHALPLVALSIAIRGAQCFLETQRVTIEGLDESEFAVYQTMNNQKGIITETNIMHQGLQFCRVRLQRFPYAECLIPNDKLKLVPDLDMLPHDARVQIVRHLTLWKRNDFLQTCHANRNAVKTVRKMDLDQRRPGHLAKISEIYRQLFEVTDITPAMILDSFNWMTFDQHQGNPYFFQQSTTLLARTFLPDTLNQDYAHLMLKTGGRDMDIPPGCCRKSHNFVSAVYKFQNGALVEVTQYEKVKWNRYARGLGAIKSWGLSEEPIWLKEFWKLVDETPKHCQERHLAALRNLARELQYRII